MTEPAQDTICPLCGRPIPPDARQSAHHLTPKLKGGKRGPTVRLHQICHTKIHATLSEAEIGTMIDQAIADTGAAGMRDMGKVMGILKPKVQGRADVGAVSAAVKQRLAG